jgi:alpha-L-rhamnosidase
MRVPCVMAFAAVFLGALPLRLPAAPGGAADPGLPPPAADLAKRARLDPRVREYISPARVVWKTTDPKSPVENAEALLGADSGQVTLSNPVACTLRHKGQAPGIVLDFGRELSGGVQIQMSASHQSKPVRLRVRFGESVSEAMSELGGATNATNDHAIRDQTCLVP